jgi:heat shock protein HtpX
MGFLIGLLMLLGYIVGGGNTLVVMFFFALALIINFVTYWFSDRMILKMYRARVLREEENPSLQNVVSSLASQAGIPKPRVAIIPSDSPNAFATGRSPSTSVVAVTNGAQSMLSDDELEGVLAHEISHIKNRDTLIMVLAAAVAGAIGYLAFMARWSLFMGGNRRNDGGASLIALILLLVLIPLAAFIIRLAISRGREYLADRGGATYSGKPGSLADALQKIEGHATRRPAKGGNPATSHLFIVNPFRGDAITSIFSTHPPTKERVKRLRQMEVDQRIGKVY